MLEKWLDVARSFFDLLTPFGVGLLEILRWIGQTCPKTAIVTVLLFILWRYNRNAARKYMLMRMRLLEERGKMTTKWGFSGVFAIVAILVVVGIFYSTPNRRVNRRVDSTRITPAVQTQPADISKIRSLPERRDRK